MDRRVIWVNTTPYSPPRDEPYFQPVNKGEDAYLLEGMPSFRILDCRVVRFMPRRAAAPTGPPTTQRLCSRALRMWSLSASSSVATEA